MPDPERLPNHANVARACGRGYDSGIVTVSAFEMREVDKPLKKISVDWVECPYDSEDRRNEDGSVARLKHRLSQGGNRRIVKQPVAFLPVEDIHAIRRQGVGVSVIQDGHGSGAGACHSGIFGFTDSPVDLEIQQDLAEIANRHVVKWLR